RHEVDDLGRDLFGRDRQVAFVLAVFIVDDDDHPAVAEGADGSVNLGERSLLHFGLTPSSARSTYLPSMSHSTFTRSFGFNPRRLVCCQVYGMICTSKRRSSTPATVRLTPSRAIEPLRTICEASEGGNRIVSHQKSPSWRISSTVPVAS